MKTREMRVPSKQLSFLRSLQGKLLIHVVRLVPFGRWDQRLNPDVDVDGTYLLEFEGNKVLYVDGCPNDKGDNLLVYQKFPKTLTYRNGREWILGRAQHGMGASTLAWKGLAFSWPAA